MSEMRKNVEQICDSALEKLRGVVKSKRDIMVDVCRVSSRKVYGECSQGRLGEEVTFSLWGESGLAINQWAAFSGVYPDILSEDGKCFCMAEVVCHAYHMNNSGDFEVPVDTRVRATSLITDCDDDRAYACADAIYYHFNGESLLDASYKADEDSVLVYISEIKIPEIFKGLGLASYIFDNIHKFCVVGHIKPFCIYGLVYGDGDGSSRMSNAVVNAGFHIAPLAEHKLTAYASFFEMGSIYDEMCENYNLACEEDDEEAEDYDDCDGDCENCEFSGDCDDSVLGDDCSDCDCGCSCKGCHCDIIEDDTDEEPFEDCDEDCECHNCKGCCDGTTEDSDDDEINVRNCGGCGGCATKVSDNEADGSCYDCQHVGVCECNLLGFSTCVKKPDKKSK